ncbi:MAG TPA: response regulator transcription factor [Alphaproteobacteria bacterium]|nr:response regulator transcription factor [Alphaproteobacteria bacterium]
MSEAAHSHSVHVVAPDDMLVRALNQHAGGWRAVLLADPPESDALVIIDLDDASGRRDAVGPLREAGFAGPVLILGARDAKTPEDEPIARPVRLGTLLARIEAHWTEDSAVELLQLGPYEFVPAEQLLRGPGSDAVIRLTELERKLLLYLASVKGAAVDRDQLLAHVWGYSAGVDTHTVETHIWRLRQKIETEDPASRFLVTEAGKYRLVLAGAEQPE